jgi:hypothetical protein
MFLNLEKTSITFLSSSSSSSFFLLLVESPSPSSSSFEEDDYELVCWDVFSEIPSSISLLSIYLDSAC